MYRYRLSRTSEWKSDKENKGKSGEPWHERNIFEAKHNAAADTSTRAMFGGNMVDRDSIKRYSKKQFFLPSWIEDWATQLKLTTWFIDRVLTCDDGIAFKAYRAHS